jgi:hypothetical protein
MSGIGWVLVASITGLAIVALAVGIPYVLTHKGMRDPYDRSEGRTYLQRKWRWMRRRAEAHERAASSHERAASSHERAASSHERTAAAGIGVVHKHEHERQAALHRDAAAADREQAEGARSLLSEVEQAELAAVSDEADDGVAP